MLRFETAVCSFVNELEFAFELERKRAPKKNGRKSGSAQWRTKRHKAT